jgi:hypothetical protein
MVKLTDNEITSFMVKLTVCVWLYRFYLMHISAEPSVEPNEPIELIMPEPFDVYDLD